MNNLENKKMMSIGYEDTDKKLEIEIYGLKFEINKEKISKNKKIDEIKGNENDLENQIEELLGANAVEKINKKRVSDGHNEMTIDVQVQVLKFIYITYIKSITTGMTNDLTNVIKTEKNKVINMQNRQEKRNYNRNRRYNNRNYRRY